MSVRMFARDRGQILASSGGDQIITGIALPQDTVLNDVKVKVNLINQGTLTTDQAAFFGVEAYILPVLDPDAGVTFETLWDTLVPKDIDTQTIDLDTGATDTTPFFEPGEVDWTQLLDVGLRPRKVYSRYRMSTVHNAVFAYKDSESPFEKRYQGGDQFTIRIKRPMRVRQPSAFVVGLASPSMDDTTTSLRSVLAENEWPRIKYAGTTLEHAMIDLLGLVEAGAETPWEDATDLLQKYLEPDVYEETAGRFSGVNWLAFYDSMFDLSVVGRLGVRAVSTGR